MKSEPTKQGVIPLSNLDENLGRIQYLRNEISSNTVTRMWRRTFKPLIITLAFVLISFVVASAVPGFIWLSILSGLVTLGTSIWGVIVFFDERKITEAALAKVSENNPTGITNYEANLYHLISCDKELQDAFFVNVENLKVQHLRDLIKTGKVTLSRHKEDFSPFANLVLTFSEKAVTWSTSINLSQKDDTDRVFSLTDMDQYFEGRKKQLAEESAREEVLKRAEAREAQTNQDGDILWDAEPTPAG